MNEKKTFIFYGFLKLVVNMAELIATPQSQSMFVNGSVACAAIATVFALFCDLDEIRPEDMQWELVAKAGAQVWSDWRATLPPEKSHQRYCEAYELLDSVQLLQTISPIAKNYEVVTGYVCDDMVTQVAFNNETDNEAREFDHEPFTAMATLSEALVRKLVPGRGGVLVNQSVTIGLWRSLLNPATYYVFDSHTAFVGDDGVRRARVFRFQNAAQLSQWYRSDMCDMENLDMLRPASGLLSEFSNDALEKFMYSLTCFVTPKNTAAAAAAAADTTVTTSHINSTCAEMEAAVRDTAAAAAAAATARDTVHHISDRCGSRVITSHCMSAPSVCPADASPSSSGGYRPVAVNDWSNCSGNCGGASAANRTINNNRWMPYTSRMAAPSSTNRLAFNSGGGGNRTRPNSSPAYRGLWK